jgi:hypothetical protein
MAKKKVDLSDPVQNKKTHIKKVGNFTVKEFCPRCEKVVTKKVGTDCKYCGYPNSWKEEE